MTTTWASVDYDVIAAVDTLIAQTIGPQAVTLDATGQFPAEGLAALADAGLGILQMDKSLGGTGSSTSTYAEALSRVSAACGATSTVYMTQMHAAHPIHLLGSQAQIDRWIPALCDGTAIGSIALTEPGAGSDVGAMRTVARRDGDSYVINGEKTFISNGDRADVVVLFASVDTALGKAGVTTFLLDTAALDGFTPGLPMKKLGQKGASTVSLSFQDCRIPLSARMGEEGQGYPLLLRSVTRSRISAAAQGVGFAQGAFDAVVTWAAERDLLSSRTSHAQDLQFELARLRGEITAARTMLLSVSDLVDASAEEPVAEVSLVKMHCTTLGTTAAARCVELLGPDGDLVSLGAERCLRDAKIAEIYDGTNQVQSMLVARDIRLAATAGNEREK
ncbi:acyl-CoA dehydrogenase [Rhodococcus sp. 06-156-3C]|uniref:acyl-CoA dehydrogenase family protein n=1 Tax=Nocardiaceae TaxID=85025 RepID=UPI000522FD42|nr:MULTISPECIES: acyl-CoA dehydrogenase family protein [Rhodococcus]OZD11628.1 acyl-CoA dehydrogenase [Rhodococcus sp. 06-156-4C]OZD15470.1 acyl-CoA dehydrogenase [Rhodococcus sp. 06-156-4a]OZD23636.1 acyl-CoA dehydrogenase [Rhodococcus sp. 06-156-3C]OZD27292.1 acyl-CoA dehydrogenase [Rhodococcus sp. 06-156-3b]OZD31312.1 acyl-CoA dehydrogenase [Rhodococcus sp. 06-156-3]